MSIANLFEPNDYTIFAHQFVPDIPGPVPTSISVNSVNALGIGLQITSATAGQPINITSNGAVNINSASGTSVGVGGFTNNGTSLFGGGDFTISDVGHDITTNSNNVSVTTSANLQFTIGGTTSFNLGKISNVADPTLAQDVATKNYVDGLSQPFNANITTPSGGSIITCNIFKDAAGVVHMAFPQLGPSPAGAAVNIESGFDIPVAFRPTSIEEYNYIISVTDNSTETTGKIIVRDDGSFTIKLSTGATFTNAGNWGVNRTAVSWI